MILKGDFMHSQRGITLTGFLVFAGLAVGALLLAFKIGPAYSEFYVIQKIMRTVASEPAMKNASRGEINTAFNNRATIENIKAITYNDIEVTKEGDRLILTASYSVRVPLFYNLSACMDFSPSSERQ
ncbi:MAG: hypothetical protein RLZZ445_2353 [Pseudomonadota bacterium]|jgi:hypothetical protein